LRRLRLHLQLPIQLAGAGVTLLVCVVGTSISFGAVWLITRISNLALRVNDESDVDAAQHNETAYHHLQHVSVSADAHADASVNAAGIRSKAGATEPLLESDGVDIVQSLFGQGGRN
jgi:hypothetical protein